MTLGRTIAAALLATMMISRLAAAEPPLLIAHRGASGYVPEHTLLAVATAHVMGADYIEQDVVLSADRVPVILHDIHLDTTTDVATRFPDRARADGRWYAIDFTLQELKTLAVSERRSGADAPAYPDRFPLVALPLRIPTLAEEVVLIDGLNKSRGRTAGLYIEFKGPAFHRQQGMDIATAVLEVLDTHGLNDGDAKVFLQCFDPETLRELHDSQRTPLPLIQLIAENSWGEVPGVDFDAMRRDEGLSEVAQYADGIGPWIPHLFLQDGEQLSPLVAAAHDVGLAVHPYTLRRDDPGAATDFTTLQRRVLIDANVDGVFSDFPDLTRQFIDQHFRAQSPSNPNKDQAP